MIVQIYAIEFDLNTDNEVVASRGEEFYVTTEYGNRVNITNSVGFTIVVEITTLNDTGTFAKSTFGEVTAEEQWATVQK